MNSVQLLPTILDPQVFAFETGYSFRGMTISENSQGYNIILRAYAPDKSAVYAMGSNADPLDGLQALFNALSTAKGTSLWRIDNYAK